jgi:putative ABC transport system permease protein
MFRNCLAAAWRNALHDRLYALLNVLGLAMGFAVVLLIWLFVRDELSFNRFLPNYQDIYRVQLTIGGGGERLVTWAGTPDRMASELKLDFPEIIGVARDAKQSVGMRRGEVMASEAIEWVDADFLNVTGYPLLRGDPATALAQPDSIVLTERLARKYFGGIDCVGLTLDINKIHPIRVTGIAADPPSRWQRARPPMENSPPWMPRRSRRAR